MADRYWVGGSGTWNNVSTTNWSTTSGGPNGASPPVAGDDVFFNSASNGTSYTVGMVSGTYAYRNITIAGPLTGTVSFSTGPSATHNISGSVAVAASGVASLGNNLWGSVNLTATTSGQTISLNGNTFSTVTFNGVGGAWTITTNGGSTFNTTLTAGTLNFDSVTWNTGNDFISSNTNVRALNLGSATINVADDWTFTTTTNLTFSAGTSTINMTGTGSAVFNGGGLTYNTVNFAPSGTGVTQDINGANTFANVGFLGPTGSSSYNVYEFTANQIITGTLTATGASAIRRIFLRSTTITTTITLTAAAVALAHVDFQSITVTGAAVPATGTGLGDCGGNSGITFPAAKTVYWNLAGSQVWSATGWATTPSGSPAIENFPLAQDTAVFTNSGSAGTVTIQSFNIGAVDASGRTTGMILNYGNAATFYGSHLWGSGTTPQGASNQTFSGRGTMTFNSAGAQMPFNLIVDCVTGTFLLGAALFVQVTISHLSGTFNTANFSLTVFSFSTTGTSARTITLGTSTINLTGTGTVWNLGGSGLTVSGASSTINLTSTSATSRTMGLGSGVSYGTINIGGATGTSTTTIDPTTTNITTLSSTKTVAHTILFTGSVTIANWTVTGTAGNVVTVNSSSVGTQRTITYTGSRINLDYMSFQNINFSYTLGAANPYLVYAGANSVNGGNNSGIAFLTSTQTAYRLTTGTTWTVPAGWNNSNNVIHMIGAGGGGATAAVSGQFRAAGGGGGGGGYTVITNFNTSPGQSIAYSVGTSASNTNGTNTTWNSGAFVAGGGQRGNATTAPLSTGGAGGTGDFAGGTGGAGSTGATLGLGHGAGGGGGAGGPNGVGGNGGTGFGNTSITSNIAGGGGGGNGGGGAGANATSAQGGNGGNNFAGTGSGAGSASGSGTAGTVGGGGGGAANTGSGGAGGAGIDLQNTLGGGGGGGGNATGSGTVTSGLYGGGGSGGRVTTAGSFTAGYAGSQGVIFIVYTPGSDPIIMSGVTIEGGVTFV